MTSAGATVSGGCPLAHGAEQHSTAHSTPHITQTILELTAVFPEPVCWAGSGYLQNTLPEAPRTQGRQKNDSK